LSAGKTVGTRALRTGVEIQLNRQAIAGRKGEVMRVDVEVSWLVAEFEPDGA
jgi:hypothetical protein